LQTPVQIFVGSQNINGSVAITGSLTTTGAITAQTLNVQQVTSSIVYSSGSNIFGNSVSNTQSMTGSVGISGSLSVNGVSTLQGALTGTSATFTGTLIQQNITDGINLIGLNTSNSVRQVNLFSTTVYSFLGTVTNNPLYLGTNDTVRLTITSGGNVGIGTSTPSDKPLTIYNSNSATLYQTPTSGTTNTSGFYVGQTSDVSYVWNYNNFPLVFGTNNTERMRLDSAGNLGLGVTPSAWGSTYKVLQFPGGYVGSDSSLLNGLGQNFVWSGSAYLYVNNGFSCDYYQYLGQHVWRTAPSGTAGNAISFTQAMTLTSGNNLLVGTTTDAGYKLDVNGTGRFSSSVTAGGNSNASIVIRANGLNNTVVSSTTLWSDTAPLISVANSSTTANTAAGFQIQVGGGSAIAGVLGIAESTSQASLGLFTGGSGTISEKVRITSGGNVGIGTTNPNILGTSFTNQFTVSTTSGFANIAIAGATGSGGGIDLGTQTIRQAGIYSLDGSNLVLYTNGTNSGNTITPRMRITSDGDVLVGRDTTGLTNTSGTTISGGSIQAEESSYVFYGNRTTSDGLFMGIRRNNVDVGSITVTTSATAFNTSSDYRLKTDFKDYNGLNLINSIKTYDYAWVIDNTRAYGVKAHELAEVIPNAVFGEKDEINEDGSVKSQAVDYSKLVPILVKAIQEQQSQIEALKLLIK
jgi:hypothetical protein